MDKKNISNLTNAELNLYMKTLENEYEALKNTIKNSLQKMEALDKLYYEAKILLYNRTRGKI